MQALIRKALDTDVYEFAACQISSWQAAYKGIVPDEYLASLSVERRAELLKQNLVEDQNCQYCCMLINDKIIGILVFGKARDAESSSVGEIYAIYLLEEYFDKGFGKLLMRHALEALKAMGFHEVVLWTLKENHRARHFYEKAGFMQDGREMEITLGKPLMMLSYTRTLG